jgi:F-type H+-transporting ATPase subunit a
MPKTRRGKLGCVIAILLLLGLCMWGLLLGGIMSKRDPPEISMAAEKVYLPFAIPLFGHEIPNTLPTTWLTMLLLIVISYFAFRKPKLVPSGLQNVVEAPIELFYNFIEGVAGEKTRLFFPLVATFFFFILISNWMGLLPGFGSITAQGLHEGHMVKVPLLRSANADLNTTIALALISVVATQVFGFRGRGLAYLGKFFTFKGTQWFERPVNTFVGILELISEFIKIVSFSFRLFGNIFAGEVLLIVIGFLAAFVASLPFMVLEIFVGFVQALIFAMLSLVFFLMAVQHGGGGGH